MNRRIAALQMSPVSPEVNEARLVRALQEAATAGVELVLAAELAVSGYNQTLATLREVAKQGAEIVARLADAVATTGVALATGLPRLRDGTLYNSAVLITPEDGVVLTYDKCHLFGDAERATFAPGDRRSQLVDWKGLKVGLLICYDVEFPEMVRALALDGMQLALVPTALPKVGDIETVSDRYIPTRAFENGIFVAYAGLCGEERGMDYLGGSHIAAPNCQTLAKCGVDEVLLVADLETDLVGRADRSGPYLRDRRPELYGNLTILNPRHRGA